MTPSLSVVLSKSEIKERDRDRDRDQRDIAQTEGERDGEVEQHDVCGEIVYE